MSRLSTAASEEQPPTGDVHPARRRTSTPVAIACSECGRGYDATLFQFGRTIECACGARVGHDPPERDVVRGPDTRFFCDAMLGRLARWLRALGYDTRYRPRVEDGTLAREAVREERLILTRDRAFPDEWRVGGCRVLEEGAPLELLRRLRERLELGPAPAPFSRCLECNGVLEWAPRSAVDDEVPERVLERHDLFRRCGACGWVYWEGSHVRRMRRELREALGVELEGP